MTRRGVHVLVGVMSLVGSTSRSIEGVLIEARSYGVETADLSALLEWLEVGLGAEPGTIESGPHILAVARL